MQEDLFLEELQELKFKIDFILNNKNIITAKHKETFLRDLEKTRYNLFDNVKINNKYSTEKIEFINNNYKVEVKNGILKINIPEVLPKFKNVSNYAYKNIMLNVSESCRVYENLFKDKLTFVLIIVHEKQENMDIDNKYVKPIIDGLVVSKIIQDDNINNMFYSVIGKNDTKKPYTEVFVMDSRYLIGWIESVKKLF
ncbi:MAG: hypothetical protein IJN50_00700 [Clostridia bacterium]|nr:hypothetical protein [Clostridia bacterium]